MGCAPGPRCFGDTSGELEDCRGEPILRNFICLITALIAPERNDGPKVLLWSGPFLSKAGPYVMVYVLHGCCHTP